MSAVISTVLTMLQALIPLLGIGSSPLIDKILSALISIVPVVIKEAQDLAPVVKNIIAALSSNPATTEDQLATLDQLDAQVDAEFDAALAAAKSADAAAVTSASS